MNFTTTNLERFSTTSDFFVDRGFRVERVAVLVHVTQLHGFTNGDGS